MISYDELVMALNELNGRAPARPKQETQPKVSGGLPKAAPESARKAVALPDDDFDDSEPIAAVPMTTEVPEAGDAFEVMTEEPLPPLNEAVADDSFDILSESELPAPPADVADAGGEYAVLGDQAFSGFFDENGQPQAGAPDGMEEEDLADLPTPPPEDFDIDLPPPPPPA